MNNVPEINKNIAEWSSLVARRAHNPKVGGSNPPPATIKKWQNESSATFFALGRLASAQGDKIRVLTHRKGPSGLAGGGISM